MRHILLSLKTLYMILFTIDPPCSDSEIIDFLIVLFYFSSHLDFIMFIQNSRSKKKIDSV